MTIQIQRTGFIGSLISMIVIAGLGSWALYHGLLVNPEMNWLAGLGGLSLLAIFFFPIGTASDLSSEIPQIKKLKEDARFKNVKVRHPSFWWVVTWSVAAVFTGGLTWFLALFMVSGAINLDIPDDIAVASGLKEGASPGSTTPQKLATSSEELLRWKKLLDDGVISEEEFGQKKAELI